jgi:ribose 5-phosphate isomerase A
MAMASRDDMKRAAATAALRRVPAGRILGVGTGSTVAYFIEGLATLRPGERPAAAVSTSADTAMRLAVAGVDVVALAEVRHVPVYVDGADEIDPLGRMLKGLGGALTMEKAVAGAATSFVCIVDESKLVERLGTRSPVVVEIEEGQTELVRELVGVMGAKLELREERSDAGNPLAELWGLDISDPGLAEAAFGLAPGVVGCGIFAARRADLVVVGVGDGSVRELRPGVDRW